MKFATFAIALLVGISEANNTRNSRVMANDPSNYITCYHGNQREFPVFGPNTPPCWYREPDNVFSCYQINPNTGKCPGFPNPVRKPASHSRPTGNRQVGRKHGSHRVKATNSPNTVTCYHGNQKEFPVYGQKAPPCWYKEDDGSISCYEYDPATGNCPDFPNPIHRSGSNRKTNESKKQSENNQHGQEQIVNKQGEEKLGEEKQIEERQAEENLNEENLDEEKLGEEKQGEEKQDENKQGEEKQGEEKQGENKQGEEKQGEEKQGEDKQGENKQSEAPAKTAESSSNSSCFVANQKEYPISLIYAPPCWFKEADGSTSCYEFDPATGKCPNFPNPIPNNVSDIVTRHPIDADTCYAGNMRDKPIQDPKRELCWYKQADGTNACFDKVNGNCPF